MTCIVGIDPGLSGAIAVLNAAGELEQLSDLPVIRDGRLSRIDGGLLQSLLIDSLAGRPDRTIIERVSAMPRQGVASSFNTSGAAPVCGICVTTATKDIQLNFLGSTTIVFINGDRWQKPVVQSDYAFLRR